MRNLPFWQAVAWIETETGWRHGNSADSAPLAGKLIANSARQRWWRMAGAQAGGGAFLAAADLMCSNWP